MQPIAVITGCGRRLGAYLTEQLLERGYRVYGQYLSSCPKVDDNPDFIATQVDFRDASQVAQWRDQLLTELPRLDLLVNNASMYLPDEAGAPVAQLRSMMQIHVEAPWMLVNALAPLLSSAGGCIVNLTDIYIHHPNEHCSAYCASKAALDNLSQSWAKQLAPKVRVNTIEPGPILFLDEHSDAYRQQILAKTPLKVEGGLEPIWQALWMMLNNPYMTGARIKVDGGRSLAQL
ncbi:SDR family oxidoreductase [Ferrimonas aestuarii]|uniref:SDR family NAD(P)-dependent oxidoreductase n=1 Tax=Ferrimonas aestuarii TaxID=2569539 RepID=A0A4U1BRG3_9GAMM|nr:SDR family NAD(P)-dependent oxidoreductase [Ferrimonas aestuarii]TKB58193.1 SDR family NAD(P)-dependent oxidoreductase [Ferrimonas aestuarii]